jgi:tetratricopeptide (TPR) repeat protein
MLDLARDQGKSGLDALLYLAGQRDLPPADAQAIIPLLKSHPLATDAQRLLALDLAIAADPSDRTALVDKAFAEQKGADPVKRRAFGVWLNEHGEPGRTLDLIPLAEALTRKDLLLVDLDALAAQKRWADIEKILGGKNVPLDDVYTQIFLARSALEQGEQTIASLHWTRALQAAGPSVEEMWFLGNYAEKIGQVDQAALAYEALKSNATSARPAYEALLRLAEARGDDDAALRLLREMVQRWPHDDAVVNDYTYFSLLNGSGSVQEDLKRAVDLVNQSPASLAHRTTLALAFYRLHDGASAMNVYAGLQIPWDRVPASHRAVHAAVLGLAGRSDEARAEAGAIRMEDLRPKERELVKPWRPL